MTLTVSYYQPSSWVWNCSSSQSLAQSQQSWVQIQMELIPSAQEQILASPLHPYTCRGKEAVKILSCKVFHSSICCCISLMGLREAVETLRRCGWVELRNSCYLAAGVLHLQPYIIQFWSFRWCKLYLHCSPTCGICGTIFVTEVGKSVTSDTVSASPIKCC